MNLSAGDLLGIAFIVFLVVSEWLYQKNKYSASEATNKAVFGFLAFGFFYGIWTANYLLAGVCLLFLIFQIVYKRKVVG